MTQVIYVFQCVFDESITANLHKGRAVPVAFQEKKPYLRIQTAAEVTLQFPSRQTARICVKN